MKKLKIGIAGLGRMGMTHAKNITRYVSNVEVVAACSLEKEQLEIAQNELGIKDVYLSFEEMIDNADIDTVVIATPTIIHPEHAIYAMKAGKNVFCEKALSMSMDDEKNLEVLKVQRETGAKVQIGFNRRFDKDYRDVYEQVRAGKLGNLEMVKITSRDPFVISHELIKRIGGLVFDFTMHDFDMARYMMGKEVKEVIVKGNTLIDKGLKELNDVDTLVAILEFEDGSFAVIDNSRRTTFGYDQRVEVFGEKGMLVAENVSGSNVKFYGEEGTVMKNPYPIFMDRYHNAYVKEIQMFVDTLLNGGEIQCKLEDVIKAQRIAVAAFESLQNNGRAVSVDCKIDL
ncbi:myo-inositol 2-dehydrogenase [Peptostreptococcus russellii]|uniref:Myo-inositol 2-dehydrogenase n=1 Tax=Peptostreptococcus russellii TaxID=215200 RepID=A0A1H8GQY5_9FIRM|nr:inositol 2-dehydrogenase [Peptostreptococcus russellii]SEN46403.1 myo-inositol 2-dehydrogenase [Peptostreptococcus russellii]